MIYQSALLNPAPYDGGWIIRTTSFSLHEYEALLLVDQYETKYM
ncbi:hypothetical protein [Ravibacter arvi]